MTEPWFISVAITGSVTRLQQGIRAHCPDMIVQFSATPALLGLPAIARRAAT